MILKQKDAIAGNLNQKLTKLGHRRLDIKLEELLQIESTIQDMIKGAQTKRKAQLQKILQNLKNISNNCRNKTIPILWYCNNGLVGQYPVELANYDNEGIDCMDYIVRPNNQIAVRIHYDQLINLIAFEMMHKDMGYSHKDMEERLYDIGIITQNQIAPLMDILIKEEPYRLSKLYKIQKSSYRSDDEGVMFDYFQNMTFTTDFYDKPVEYSCRHALQFILDSILDMLKEYNVPFTLCAIDDQSMTFLIDKDKQSEFTKIATEPVTIRVFGRLFDTVATIENLEGTEDDDE